MPAFLYRGPPECFERVNDASKAQASPVNLDYRTANTASIVHRTREMLLGGDDPASLPALQHGDLQENQAMGCALLEVESRVAVPGAMLILPAVSLQLAWPGDLDASQEAQLSVVLHDIQTCKFVWVAIWAPSHYTLLEASRPDEDSPWALMLWDSLLGGHAPSSLMASTIARRLFDMDTLANACSAARSQPRAARRRRCGGVPEGAPQHDLDPRRGGVP